MKYFRFTLAVFLTVNLSLFAQKEKVVAIATDYGVIKVKLYNETPLHRDNFIKLVEEGVYDGTVFHRVIENFMIQGGDPESKNATPEQQLGNGGPGYTLPAEILPQYFHKKGALAAARQGDNVNPERRSSGSQFYIVQGRKYNENNLKQMENRKNQPVNDYASKTFFNSPENQEYLKRLQTLQQNKNQEGIQMLFEEIQPKLDEIIVAAGKKKMVYSDAQKQTYATLGGTPHLDDDYTVFGEVIEGLEVVDKIASVQTNRSRPTTDVKMTMKVVKK